MPHTIFEVTPPGETSSIRLEFGNVNEGWLHLKKHQRQFAAKDGSLGEKKAFFRFLKSQVETTRPQLIHKSERHYQQAGWIMLMIVGSRQQIVTCLPYEKEPDLRVSEGRMDDLWKGVPDAGGVWSQDELSPMERMQRASKMSLALSMMGK